MKQYEQFEIEGLGTVWVVCPYPLVTLGLEKALEMQAHAHSGQNRPSAEGPSFVILCPDGEEDVTSEVKRLRALAPDAPILVLGLRNDLPFAWTALKAGARGFLHAGMAPDQIARALSVTARGEVVAPRGLLEFLLTDGDPSVDLGPLSARQREILELVANGLTNAQIAQRLFLAESTVKQHLRATYKLLGVKNRAEAAKLARANARQGSPED